MVEGRKYFCSEAIGLTIENQFTAKFECRPKNCPRDYYQNDWDEVHETCYLKRWWRDSGGTKK